MTTELGEAVARCKNLTRDGRDINTVNVNCDDLETILAELGRVPGVPDGWKLVPIEPNWDMRNEGREFLIDGLEKDYEKIAYFLWKTMVNASPTAPTTRPPALGELSDEQWYALLNVMDAAAADAASINDSWEDINKNEIKAAGKAAREFLGKVDG